MNTEILMLAFGIIIGFLQLFVAAGAATSQRGVKWNLSSRDQTPAPLVGVAGRLDRCLQNYKETFPFFLAAVLLVLSTQTLGLFSQIGSILYIVARLVYIPLYAFDVTKVRTLFWLLSVIGIFLIVFQFFLVWLSSVSI